MRRVEHPPVDQHSQVKLRVAHDCSPRSAPHTETWPDGLESAPGHNPGPEDSGTRQARLPGLQVGVVWGKLDLRKDGGCQKGVFAGSRVCMPHRHIRAMVFTMGVCDG
jgi:hypothetical protein